MTLPEVGQNRGTWGEMLLEFLRVSHNEDGTLKGDVGGIDSVSDDTSPSLGGDLDLNGHEIPGVTDSLAAVEEALTVGDPGDLKATNAAGTAITNIKPGRIDARVWGCSTASSDNSATLKTLADLAASEGAELWIPEGEYRAKVSLKAQTRISGTGTIKPPTGTSSGDGWILGTDTSDPGEVEISGITVDGGGVIGAVTVNDYPDWTTANIHHVTFQNVLNEYPHHVGVFAQRPENLRLHHCTSIGCELVLAVNPRGLDVFHNLVDSPTVDGVNTGNGITVWADDTNVCPRIRIGHNTILNVKRIGIELFSNNYPNAYFDSPILVGNEVTVPDSFNALEGFGFSVTSSPNATVACNTAKFVGVSTTLPAYGFEFIAPRARATDNYARGFGIGYIWNSAERSVGMANVADLCHTGFQSAASTGPANFLQLISNVARNPRDIGFDIYGYLQATAGGDILRDNIVERTISWTGDSSRTFDAFKVQASAFAPRAYDRNTIIQGMASPTLSAFRAFAVYISALGDAEGTEFINSLVVDEATTPMVDYWFSNSGSGDVADVVRSSNRLMDSSGYTANFTTW